MHRLILWTLALVCASVTSAFALPDPLLHEASAGSTSGAERLQLASDDRELIARALIGEAAGEGHLGMMAVAHVIRNRMVLSGVRIQHAKAFGRTVPEVLQQFDAMNPRRGGSAYRMAWGISLQHPTFLDALSIVDDVFAATTDDPTGGALFYYNPSTVRTPGWVAHFAPTNDRIIGNHRFVGQLSSVRGWLDRTFGHFLDGHSLTLRMRAAGLQG